MTGSAAGTAKIAIAGAGYVGVTLAYACVIRGTGKTIALYDSDAGKVRAEVADLQARAAVRAHGHGGRLADIAVREGADVLVLTVGGLPQPGQTRLDLAAGSVTVCRDLLPPLLNVAPDAVALIVTNPVDVVTYAALRIRGLPRHQVLGSGTVLESSRLRSLTVAHCGVAAQSVHAYIAGQHGDLEIALRTSATRRRGTGPALG